MLEWLQEWYANHCDGDWEHENGVAIDTIDNPGWSIAIDLNGTELEGIAVPYTLNEVSNEDWIAYSVEKNVFKAAGGPSNLNKMIEVFKRIFESVTNKPS